MKKHHLKKKINLFLVLIVILVLGSFFVILQSSPIRSTPPTFSSIARNIHQTEVNQNDQTDWKEFQNGQLSFKYPPNWEVVSADNYVTIKDPKSCYPTHSRPPTICERLISLQYLSSYDNQTAKQYLDELEAKRAEDARKYKARFDEVQNEHKDAYAQSYTNPFPPLQEKETFTNGTGTNLDLYSTVTSYAKYGSKEFVISNNKRLYVGGATLKSIDDNNIESQILKSISID